MTLKCWTSGITQTPTSPAAATTPSAAAANASANPPPMITPILTARAAGASPHSSNNHHHHSHNSHGFTDMRRRSVGFINISSLLPATGPLVTTPSRNPNVHKVNRLRSLSSTWDASDMDDDDAAEEKTGDTYGELSRRELMYTQIASSLNSTSSTMPHDGLLGHTPRRRGNHNSRNARIRRRRTVSESSGSATANNNSSRRVRILTPVASKVCFGGWVRGQPAEVRWEVVDKSVQSVRIDVCNVAWTVPTTIASRVPNDGNFLWKRVYWGMPITDGYYVNIYDVTEVSPEQQASPDPQQQPQRPPDQPSNGNQPAATDGAKTDLVLLARSDCFAVIG